MIKISGSMRIVLPVGVISTQGRRLESRCLVIDYSKFEGRFFVAIDFGCIVPPGARLLYFSSPSSRDGLIGISWWLLFAMLLVSRVPAVE